jgi:hypothetical protein
VNADAKMARLDGEARGAALAPALAGLRALYADLDRELAQLAPRCELSGRCCDFKKSGLTLFATDLELAHLARHAPPPLARDPALCPWWKDRLCHARDGRPLGCRIYFCDESKADALEELSTRYHARLKRLHEDAAPGATGGTAVAYRYAPFVRTVHERLAAE